MNRVAGKVCIVTGAGKGIGRACALRLAQEGAQIAAFDLDEAEGRALLEALAGAGGAARHRFWRVDVSDEAAVRAAIASVVDHFGALHVLVNTAGISGAKKPTHEITEEEWDRVQAVNVKGPFFCTKHSIAHLRRSGGGSIINLSSIYGIVGAPDVPPYHASKGALSLMTKTDALTYAADGIRVNSVHPGFIWTPMVEHFLGEGGTTDLQAARSQVDQLHPLVHMGEPDDIAGGVVYLASAESKFMTGSQLVIDGGYTAR